MPNCKALTTADPVGFVTFTVRLPARASRKSETHMLCMTLVKAVRSAGIPPPVPGNHQRMNVSLVPPAWMVVKAKSSGVILQAASPFLSSLAPRRPPMDGASRSLQRPRDDAAELKVAAYLEPALPERLERGHFAAEDLQPDVVGSLDFEIGPLDASF